MPNVPIKDLPSVSEYPNRWNYRILLAYILAEMNAGVHDFPVRSIQEDLTQVGLKGVRNNVHLLLDEGWLSLEKRGRAGKGSTYSPGPRLSGNEELNQEWQEWANVFFGPEGVATYWKKTEALTHGSIGAHGLLILEMIEQEGGEMRSKVIRNAFNPLMERGLVILRLDWLETHDLVRINSGDTRGDDTATLNPEWRAILSTLFPKEGPLAMRIKTVNQQDRKAFYAFLGIKKLSEMPV